MFTCYIYCYWADLGWLLALVIPRRNENVYIFYGKVPGARVVENEAKVYICRFAITTQGYLHL